MRKIGASIPTIIQNTKIIKNIIKSIWLTNHSHLLSPAVNIEL